MKNIAKKTLIVIQILVSFFVALYAVDISSNIISNLYINIEGHYLPYGGLPYKYYFWQLVLTGALFVVISYTFLYNVKKNTYMTAAQLFIFGAIYTYNITGEFRFFNYEIILGGLMFIVPFEIIKNISASNKKLNPTPKSGAV